MEIPVVVGDGHSSSGTEGEVVLAAWAVAWQRAPRFPLMK